MELIESRSFQDEEVHLDGRHFKDCVLTHCILLYDSGQITFENTEMRGCDYLFGGPARRTTDLLHLIGLIKRARLCNDAGSQSQIQRVDTVFAYLQLDGSNFPSISNNRSGEIGFMCTGKV